MSKYDRTEVKEMMRRNALAVVDHLYSDCVTRRDGAHVFTGDIYGKAPTKSGSFMMTVEGPNAGFVKEFGRGDGTQATSLIDCWMARKGVDYKEAIQQMAEFMGVKPAFGIRSAAAAVDRAEKVGGVIPQSKMSEFVYPAQAMARRVFGDHQRLMRNPAVKSYFNDVRGISDEVLAKFQVGFQEFEYREKNDKDEETGKYWADTAIFRLRAANGDFLEHTSRLVVPGVTRGDSVKIATKGWCNLTPMAYFSDPYDAQPFLMVCEGPKDLWRQYQALKDNNLDHLFLLVTSSHGSAMPRDLMPENAEKNPHYDPEFFSRFKAVICGHDNDSAGERMACAWAKMAQRSCLRMKVPENFVNKPFDIGESGADWTDFWQAGGNINQFKDLMRQATQIAPEDYDRIYGRKSIISESYINAEMKA